MSTDTTTNTTAWELTKEEKLILEHRYNPSARSSLPVSQRRSYTPLQPTPVFSVEHRETYSGGRDEPGRRVWVVLMTDPNSMDMLPQQVAECPSIKEAKDLAAKLNHAQHIDKENI